MATLTDFPTVETPALTDYERERDKPMPSTNHSVIQNNLGFELNLRYRDVYRIMPEVSLNTPGKASVPDLCVYPRFALDVRHDVIRRDDPPLVAIEILSPEQNLQELVDKTDRYFAFGVKSCWIVLPSLKTIVVYSGVDSFAYVKTGEVLKDPNLSIELEMSKVFA